MTWYIFWFCSVLALLASIVAFYMAIRNKYEKVKPIYLLIAGVFSSCLLMILPVHLCDFRGDPLSWIKAFFVSAQDAIQFFTADADHSIIADNTACLSGWIEEGYEVLISVLIISAPILTFSFVLSFFKGITAQLRYWFHATADTYVFSEINQNSVSLAESIYAENKDVILIFANLPKEENQAIDELLDRVKNINAICFWNDIPQIKLKEKTQETKTYFFAMCDDESKSISQALQLIPKYRHRKNSMVFLFSSDIESELILNNLDKGCLIVRRINPRNAFMIHMLSSEGKRLFDTALPAEGNRKEISVLLLGLGQFGKEILKALPWYCQMDNYTLRLHAFDKDKQAEEKIAALCPELMSKEYNGVYAEGEAFYHINIHPYDVSTESFKNKVREIGQISYAFVSLGNDSLNITTAVNLRILFEQMRIHPEIVAVVTDPEKCTALAHAADRNGTPYKIRFVGDAKTVYSSKVIINSDLEKEALELHKRYNNGNPQGFYEYEYNYKSSMASVIHYDARKHCKILGIEKSDADLSFAEKKAIAVLEHKRWNAYTRAEGHIHCAFDGNPTRNDLGKIHPDLVAYEKLPDKKKVIDIRVGTK